MPGGRALRRVGALTGAGAGGVEGARVDGGAGERCLDLGGPQGSGPHVGHRDLRLLDDTVGDPEGRTDRDDRPRLGDHGELLVAAAPAGMTRYAHGDGHVVLTDGGGEVVLEELGSTDRALPGRAHDVHRPVEGEDGGTEVAGGVGVGQCATDRPAVADLGVADGRCRLGQEAGVLCDEGVGRERVVGDHRPDDEFASLLADLAKTVDLAEVDEELRGGHAHTQNRHE